MLTNSNFCHNVWPRVRVGLLPTRAMESPRRGPRNNHELGLLGYLFPSFGQHFLVLVGVLQLHQQLLSKPSHSGSGHTSYRDCMLRQDVHYDNSPIHVSLGHRGNCTLHSHETLPRPMVRIIHASNCDMVFPMGSLLLHPDSPSIIFPMHWRNVLPSHAGA